MKRLFFNLPLMVYACFTVSVIDSQCCDSESCTTQCCHPGGCAYSDEGLQEGEYEGCECCHPYFRGTHQIKEPYGNEVSYPSQRSGDLYDQLSQ